MTQPIHDSGKRENDAIVDGMGLPIDREAFLKSVRRHMVLDHVVAMESASPRERFEALATSVREVMTERWLETEATYHAKNSKRAYYLSMEFLIGRTTVNNLFNLGLDAVVASVIDPCDGDDWIRVLDSEPDAGLGNGGLGRLAACFVESMATLQLPAMGYGLRYEYGIFRQEIRDGQQVEQPDHWLAYKDPWEVPRPKEIVKIPLACSFDLHKGQIKVVPGRETHLIGIPYDRPVVGYGGRTINTLRLWGAQSPDFFDFGEFNTGDFVGAIVDRILAETVTRVLYPDDSTLAGQALRFVQEYFLVCCSLRDIVERFRRSNSDWHAMPLQIAVQMNDTHPAMAVAELMRILVDEAHLPWEEAWDLSVRCLAYTNHTLLPEALEKWPTSFFEVVAPRLLEIIHEINRRLLLDAANRFPGNHLCLRNVSLFEEGDQRQVRMANLAIVGSHSTNGVAKIHSKLLRTRVVSDLALMYPDRFNNKTNGVTVRRWLACANPELSQLITDTIGEGWITDAMMLREMLPLVKDTHFQDRFRQTKRVAKNRFSTWLMDSSGIRVNPDSIFDCQIKRIHEYKRQLLNVLHVLALYHRLRQEPQLDIPPRTFFFAGKAAPAYTLAKLIIKLINDVGRRIEADPVVRDRLQVVFLPNYNVSLAERLIPASDVSEQISTAGYEASGTGNMKFMMNGALTIGTRDGATIEMAEEAGEENFFLFGLTADQVWSDRSQYDPRWHYDNEPETREVLDFIFQGQVNPREPGIYNPIREMLLERGDYYMHLADLWSYVRAQQRLADVYGRQEEWTKMAIANVACSGRFSSDRTIGEYASEIWGVRPCPIR